MNTEPIGTAMERAARIMGERLDVVFSGLKALARQSQVLLAPAHGEGADRASLEALRAPVEELMAESQQLVDGAGLAVGPGILADSDAWLQWWRRLRNGNLQFTAHSFNPLSLNYYDYQAMNWFRIPVESHEPAVVGPYVDNGGTDLRIITLAFPFAVGDGPNSVVAADISLDRVERLLLRSLSTREHQVVLLTDSGKIVASNTARYVTGTILDLESARDGAAGQMAELPIMSALHIRIPWRLVVID